MRYVVALFLIALLNSAALAASPAGSAGLNFSCERPVGAEGKCTCSGFLDCKNMEKECAKGGGSYVITCETDLKTGKETCSCPWTQKLAPTLKQTAPAGGLRLKAQ